MLAVLTPRADEDWQVPAGSLEWSCWTTAAHVAHDLAVVRGTGRRARHRRLPPVRSRHRARRCAPGGARRCCGVRPAPERCRHQRGPWSRRLALGDVGRGGFRGDGRRGGARSHLRHHAGSRCRVASSRAALSAGRRSTASEFTARPRLGGSALGHGSSGSHGSPAGRRVGLASRSPADGGDDRRRPGDRRRAAPFVRGARAGSCEVPCRPDRVRRVLSR